MQIRQAWSAMTREIRKRQIANNMTEEILAKISSKNEETDGLRRLEGMGQEGGRLAQRLADSSGLKGGRSGESSANNERAHFLFILLLSEWPSLVDASSEPDSLAFFGRAAGIETARQNESQGEGEGKPRRRRAAVIITVAKSCRWVHWNWGSRF